MLHDSSGNIALNYREIYPKTLTIISFMKLSIYYIDYPNQCVLLSGAIRYNNSSLLIHVPQV